VKIEGSHTKNGRIKRLPEGPIKDRVKEVIGYFWKKFLVENKSKYSIRSEKGFVKVSIPRKGKLHKLKPMLEKPVRVIIEQLKEDGGWENLILTQLIQVKGSEVCVYHWLRLVLNRT